jgi:predicted nucleic acid-binding protein
MNGDKLFIDTNIVLYLLSGDETLASLLNKKRLYISFVTQLELLGFIGLKAKEERVIKNFIEQCTIIDINSAIKEKVIILKKILSRKTTRQYNNGKFSLC